MKNQKIKAVMFDIDGTLINSELALYYLFKDTLRRFKENHVTRSRILKPMGSTSKVWLKKLVPSLSRDKLERMRRWVAESYARHYMLRFATPMKYSTKTLNDLKKKGYKIGIVTNQTKKQAKVSIKIMKFNKFNTIVTANNVKRAKPYPDSMLYAMKKMGVKKDEVIMIGDTKNDYLAGKAAGVKTYLLKHKYNDSIRCTKIRTLKQVLKLVS